MDRERMRAVVRRRHLALWLALTSVGCDTRGDKAPMFATSAPATNASVAPSEPSASASAAPSASAVPIETPWVHENPEGAKVCPSDMVLVDGDYTPYAGHRCLEWIDEARDRCRVYAPPPLKAGGSEHRRFCVDRFEYPNLPGVTPAVMVDWFDAVDACHAEDKRLCLSSEWTLACEGSEILPYPYGYSRDPSKCNVDRPRPVPEPDFQAFSHPRKIGPEVARLDLRVASDEMPACVSPFGAHDMTGNVDEWVVNEHHYDPLAKDQDEEDRPYVSGLKGGYWGPIRSRCRPMTTAHNEWFRFYQVGFRCCRDPLDGSLAGPSFEKALPKNHEKPPRIE